MHQLTLLGRASLLLDTSIKRWKRVFGLLENFV